jgi:hypothetical protein
LWEWRSVLIVRKCTVDPDAAIATSLEIIDEVLDVGGFFHACDEAHVTPPTNFSSWVRSCYLFIVYTVLCLFAVHLTNCCCCCCFSTNGKQACDSHSQNNNSDTAFADAARQPERQNIILATLPGLARFVVEPADTVGDSMVHPSDKSNTRTIKRVVRSKTSWKLCVFYSF